MILRYLAPPRPRDDADEPIGQTLLTRAGPMGHIPVDAPARIREEIGDVERDDSDRDVGP